MMASTVKKIHRITATAGLKIRSERELECLIVCQIINENQPESENSTYLRYVPSSLYSSSQAVTTRFKSDTLLSGLRAEIRSFYCKY